MSGTNIKSLSNFVWPIAEMMRGALKQSANGKSILFFVDSDPGDYIFEDTTLAILEMLATHGMVVVDRDAREQGTRRFMAVYNVK